MIIVDLNTYIIYIILFSLKQFVTNIIIYTKYYEL